MITCLSEYYRLPEAAQRTLNTLRGIRDKLGEDVLGDAESIFGKERAEELMEDLLSYQYPQSAFTRLHESFMRREHCKSTVEKLSVIRVVVDSIARIERERCGL